MVLREIQSQRMIKVIFRVLYMAYLYEAMESSFFSLLFAYINKPYVYLNEL